ncbi:tyrosine-type recombinase/integrase [Streptomyces pseudogriseolus]|uniref:tyrosine-type recombinase/integrase n=1 Tax=Streptomyces pseudogriseolus TaxID=36817 RepID=UPI003FA1DEC7
MTALTLTRARVDELLADETVPVAHRALWALLWEGEVRLGDALSLDVRDIEFDAGTVRVEYPKRGTDPVSVPLGERAAELLQQTVDGRTDGPALQVEGQPISRTSAARRAHAAGAGSIHAFRSSGQAARRPAQDTAGYEAGEYRMSTRERSDEPAGEGGFVNDYTSPKSD